MRANAAVRSRPAAGGVDQLISYIRDEWGLVLDGRRRQMLQVRLQRRVRELNLSSLDHYCYFLFQQGGLSREKSLICNAVTTQTTSFFRENHHFDFIRERLVPTLYADGMLGRPIRAWSAAASTGHEAYSLAMTLADCREALGTFSFSVLATDISQAALLQIQNAVYGAEVAADIPASYRARYLLQGRTRQRHRVRVVRELRDRVTTQQQNLVARSYEISRDFDIILIRNCLIYFDEATQLRVARQLISHLRPGGHLFTGHAEHFSPDALTMDIVAPSIYRKREEGAKP